MREKVFDPFVQLDAEDDGTVERSGRGLGLTFCKLAVEAHGGRIWVEDAAPGRRLLREVAAWRMSRHRTQSEEQYRAAPRHGARRDGRRRRATGAITFVNVQTESCSATRAPSSSASRSTS